MDMLDGDKKFDPAAKRKRSFFSKDSDFWDVLGVIGDGLSGDHHYANTIQQQRQAELDEERYRQRRLDALQKSYGGRNSAALPLASMGAVPWYRSG